VRLYIGLIQERDGLIGRSPRVGLHYCLGGPESAECALGSSAAPLDRMPSSRPGDPIRNIGDWLWPVPLITRKVGGVEPHTQPGPGHRAARAPPACHCPCHM